MFCHLYCHYPIFTATIFSCLLRCCHSECIIKIYYRCNYSVLIITKWLHIIRSTIITFYLYKNHLKKIYLFSVKEKCWRMDIGFLLIFIRINTNHWIEDSKNSLYFISNKTRPSWSLFVDEKLKIRPILCYFITLLVPSSVIHVLNLCLSHILLFIKYNIRAYWNDPS